MVNYINDYRILAANNKFIKIRYKYGEKSKKIKIFIEYFKNSEELASILKEKANNGNKIKINKKYIPPLFKLILIEFYLIIIITFIISVL